MNNRERQATEELMRLLTHDVRSPAERMVHCGTSAAANTNLHDLFDLVTRAGFTIPQPVSDGALLIHTSWLENGVRREGVGG